MACDPPERRGWHATPRSDGDGMRPPGASGMACDAPEHRGSLHAHTPQPPSPGAAPLRAEKAIGLVTEKVIGEAWSLKS